LMPILDAMYDGGTDYAKNVLEIDFEQQKISP
ncbi:MAG TPA: HxlR family transcriptional regulator, partial [Exiguobacterium sp.]|nr:HxlR family transcriptional regulator [Exiguobacterium sp.]